MAITNARGDVEVSAHDSEGQISKQASLSDASAPEGERGQEPCPNGNEFCDGVDGDQLPCWECFCAVEVGE